MRGERGRKICKREINKRFSNVTSFPIWLPGHTLIPCLHSKNIPLEEILTVSEWALGGGSGSSSNYTLESLIMQSNFPLERQLS